jgi:hypothetical protein
MAIGIARKGYPNSGKYYTAGKNPGEGFDSVFNAFMEERGNAIPEAPRGIDAVRESWADYYVLVALEGKISDYVAEVPFRTIAFEWNIAAPDMSEGDESTRRAALEAAYKEIASRVRDLMEALQGEDAS